MQYFFPLPDEEDGEQELKSRAINASETQVGTSGSCAELPGDAFGEHGWRSCVANCCETLFAFQFCGSSIIKYISGTAVAAADRLQRAQLTELRAERVTEVPQL